MSDNRNRTRNRQVSFRCTPEEEVAIDMKVFESKLTKTDYLIRLLKDQEIKVYPGLQEVMSELKRQGNNLNQAMRYTHKDPSMLPELKAAIKSCNAFYNLCGELWDEIKTDPEFHFQEDQMEK